MPVFRNDRLNWKEFVGHIEATDESDPERTLHIWVKRDFGEHVSLKFDRSDRGSKLKRGLGSYNL